MRLLRVTYVALVVLATAVLAMGCEGYDTGQTDVLHAAVAGGTSTHTQTEYARAQVTGTGEIDGSCETFEVTAIAYHRTTMGPGGPADRDWVWVRVDRFCCGEEIFTRWTGAANLEIDQYDLDLPNNRHHMWSAGVTQTVTVYNRADRSQTLTLDLDLDWVGLDDFYHDTRGRKLEGEQIFHHTLDWCQATVSGDITLEGVEFDFDSQEIVRIGDQNRTTHSR